MAEYIKLPSLLEAGKFMVGLCSGFKKHCFFRSVECVGSENRKRDKKRKRWSREAEELEKLPMSELVLPLPRKKDESLLQKFNGPFETVALFSSLPPLKGHPICHYSGKALREEKNDVDECLIRSLVNSFSRVIRHEVR